MTFKKSLAVLLVFVVVIGGLFTPGYTSIEAAATDYVQVTREVTPAEITTEQEATVKLNIQGTPPESVVKPNDVILVIDKSGSMKEEDKITAAKNSAKEFIDLMDLSVHRVGVVDYSSTNSIGVLPLTTDAVAAKAYVDKITANGGTATGGAIEAAITELTSNPIEGVQPVIVIMTDGDATEPSPSSSAYAFALQKANEAKDAGIVFYTIALLNQNADPATSGPNNLLKQMATTFSHHHFVLGSVGLSDIYKAIVKEIGVASAYDVVVTDTVSDKFEIVPNSYTDNIPQPTVVGNTLTWSFKELKNNSLTFTYKIRPVSKEATGMFNVAASTSSISYKDYAGAQRSKAIPNGTVKVKLPAPVITSVTDPTGHPNGGNEVVIAGDKFVQGAKVYFGAKEATSVTYVDSQTLRAVVPAGSQGTVTVKVVNPDNQSATAQYQYIANPEVSSYTPATGPIEGNTLVVFNGNYFLSGASVKFGDQAGAVVTQRSNYMTVKTPAVTEAGVVDIVITNPDGSSLTIPQGFTYTAPEIPKLEITSVTPATGLPAGGEAVYINGKNIDSGVKIYFGTNEAQLKTYTSNSKILVTAPAGVLGAVDVKLVNPDGQEAILQQGYTYANPSYPAPTVTSITPNSSELAGGATAYVTGTNYVTGVQVYINNVEAYVKSTTATRLTITIPASTVWGTFDVKVINPDAKEAVLPGSFTYLEPVPDPAPKITAISPSTGTTAGNTTVTITGENLKSGAVVYFNDIAVPTTYASASKLTIVTPLWNTAETVAVKVVNPDGQESTEAITYAYEEPQPEPVSVTSITPAEGLTAGGNTVYISGTNFKNGIKVYFGGVEAPTVKYTSGIRISATVPAYASTGKVDVTVVNPDKGTFTLAEGYTYTLTKPTIASLTPATGTIDGGTIVYINGTNYESNMTITINGVNVLFDYLSATRVKIVTPAANAAGDVPLVITLSNGESATTNFTYELPALGPAPTLKSSNVISGTSAGGNTIYLTGTNFVKGAKVFFNGVESTKVTFTSAVRLGVQVPAGSVGDVQVWVENPDGQISNTITYTYK